MFNSGDRRSMRKLNGRISAHAAWTSSITQYFITAHVTQFPCYCCPWCIFEFYRGGHAPDASVGVHPTSGLHSFYSKLIGPYRLIHQYGSGFLKSFHYQSVKMEYKLCPCPDFFCIDLIRSSISMNTVGLCKTCWRDFNKTWQQDGPQKN